MSPFFRDLLLTVMVLGIFAAGVWVGTHLDPPTNDQMQRRYDGYRLCIPHPGCMTAEDYIDYYDLKWKLQQ